MIDIRQASTRARARRLAREMRTMARESPGYLVKIPDNWDAETDSVIALAITMMRDFGMVFEETPSGSGWTI